MKAQPVLFVSLFILLISGLYSCHNKDSLSTQKKYEALLATADTIRDSAPDSAGRIYNAIISDSTAAGDYLFNKALLGHAAILQFAGKNDSAIYWAERSLQLSRSLNDSLLIISSLQALGDNHSIMLQNRKALSYFDEALKLTENAGFKRYRANLLIGIGNVYAELAENARALKSYTEASKVSKSTRQTDIESASYNDIATIMNSQGDYREAIRYMNKALAIDTTAGRKADYAHHLLNIGTFYKNLGATKMDSALAYYTLSEEIFNKTGDSVMLIKVIYNRANMYLSQKKYQLAFGELNHVLTFSRQHSIPEGQVFAFHALSRYYRNTGNGQAALGCADSAIRLAKRNHIVTHLPDFYDARLQSLEMLGQYKEALSAALMKQELSDSLNSADQQKEISALKVQFESEQKDHEIHILSLNLDTEARSRRIQLIMIIILLLVIFGGAGLLIRIYKLLHERSTAYSALLNIYSKTQIKPGKDTALENVFPLPLPVEKIRTAVLKQTKVKTNDSVNDNQQTELLLNKLMHQLESKQVFLNANITIEKLASILKSDKKTINHLFNTKFGNEFNDVINKYRVEYAMKLFNNHESDNLKVEYIGIKSGFSSTHEFNAVFTKQTGLPPAFYRQGMAEKREECVGGT